MPTRSSKRLETFPNPEPGRDYTIRFTCPEFTCLCPRTGQPDFAGLPWNFVIVFTGIAIVGIALGTWLGRFVDQRTPQRALAVLLLLIAALVLWQNRGRL